MMNFTLFRKSLKTALVAGLFLSASSAAFCEKINPSDIYASIGEKIPEATAVSMDGKDWSTLQGPQIILFSHVGSPVCLDSANNTTRFLKSRLKEGESMPLSIVVYQGIEGEIRQAFGEDALAGATIIADEELDLFKSVFTPERLSLPMGVVTDQTGEIVYIEKGYQKGREAGLVMALEFVQNGETEKLAELKELMKMRANPESWIGKEFPDISHVEILRGEFQIPEDKFVMYEFWATWCGPCRYVSPELQRIHEEKADQIVLISISDEDTETVSRYLGKQKTTYTIGVDEGGSLGSKLGIRGIPAAYIVDPQGKIVWSGNPIQFMNDPDSLDAIIAKHKTQAES